MKKILRKIAATTALVIGTLAVTDLFAQSNLSYGPNGEVMGVAGAMSGPALKKENAQLSAEEIEAAVCQKRGNYCTISYCAENPVLKKGCEPTWTAPKELKIPKEPGAEGGGAITVEPPTNSSKRVAGKLPGKAPGETEVAKSADKSGAADGSDKKPAEDKSSSDPKDSNNSSGGNGNSQQQQQACQQAASSAYSSCSAQGGGYGGSNGGINSYGSYLSGASSGAARSNIQQGSECTSAWRQCQAECQSVNPSQASSCASLANNVSQMGQQALANNQAAQQAAQSAASSSTNPNSANANNCSVNPDTPECKTLADANKRKAGQSGFDEKEQKEVRAKDFNVGDSRDGAKLGYQGSGIGIDQIKAGAKNGTITNNGGGQIPGSGGDAGGAKLGGGRGGSPGAPGYTTDILQGYQGGGGGATAGGSTETDGSADGGFAGYGAGGSRSPSGESLDLRKYLPGGQNDPGSRLGGFRPFSLEINGPHYNIWSKVSDRYIEKCKLGELIGCR